MPSGCILIEDTIEPCRNKEIDLPSPQPGQKSNPIQATGQMLMCVALPGSINASATRAVAQIAASRGKVLMVCVTRSMLMYTEEISLQLWYRSIHQRALTRLSSFNSARYCTRFTRSSSVMLDCRFEGISELSSFVREVIADF